MWTEPGLLWVDSMPQEPMQLLNLAKAKPSACTAASHQAHHIVAHITEGEGTEPGQGLWGSTGFIAPWPKQCRRALDGASCLAQNRQPSASHINTHHILHSGEARITEAEISGSSQTLRGHRGSAVYAGSRKHLTDTDRMATLQESLRESL